VNKKKILIIGSRGMAGHTIFKYLRSLNKYYLIDIARQKLTPNTLSIDVKKQPNYLRRVIENSQPDVIINCIGILVDACNKDPENAIWINSYFPYYLAKITANTKTKIIHLSTDCVFDGQFQGKYTEKDLPTETNLYGRTKAMGEINNDKDLTLRLSIIGDELKENGTGLFNWFMKQKGNVYGYARVIWDGITTLELAKQLDKIINTKLTGLYHLAPDFNISKFNLLAKINRIWDRKDVLVIPRFKVQQNKTLVNNRKEEYDPKIPDYETQLIEMKEFIERKEK